LTSCFVRRETIAHINILVVTQYSFLYAIFMSLQLYNAASLRNYIGLSKQAFIDVVAKMAK